MSAARFNKRSRERLLYTASGLVILVILSIIIWVIPYVASDPGPEANPEKALPAFWALIAIHFIILVSLIGKIMMSRKGGRLRKSWLIIPGIILILMSMILIDAAGACQEHQPDMFSVAIVLFFSAFCDMITGIILIMLPVRLPDTQLKTHT